MPTFDIENIAVIGVVRDAPPYLLPPEAWSLAENVRCRNGAIEKLLGWSEVFATPGVAPHFAIPLVTSAQTFWLYTSLTKGYVYDGASHTNITRQSGGVDVNYTASSTKNWTGTILGGIPILNNNNDVPQFWATPNVATKLANLTNWNANRRALVIRALGPYLVAFNITDSGSNFPHQIYWSHPADPGSVPSSWDETDPTKDAGIAELPDVSSGIILDALPLAGNMYVYKETATWRMTPTGGRFIFDIKSVFETTGILAQRCVVVSPDGRYHVVATQDDIIKHNGVQMVSLLDKKMKKTIFDSLDTTNYGNSFMFVNPNYNEVWFCYPTSGATNPDRALILNMDGGLSEVTGITFRNAASGTVLTADPETWAAATGTWDTDPDAWSTLLRRKVVLCGTDATKFYQLDSTSQRDGTNFTSILQRVGLSIFGRTRTGAWIEDFEIRKFFKRVWPKVRGGTVSVRVGFQDTVDGSVRWNDYGTFDPSDTSSPAAGMTFDSVGSGRAVALEITDSDNTPWYLDGYKIDLIESGKF